MVRITIEVSNGAARFGASEQAQSIERTLEIAERQNPGKSCKGRLPIDAEAFFEEGSVAQVEAVEMVT